MEKGCGTWGTGEIMSQSMKQKRDKCHIWDTEKRDRRKRISNEVTTFAEITISIAISATNCSFQAHHFEISLRFRTEVRGGKIFHQDTLFLQTDVPGFYRSNVFIVGGISCVSFKQRYSN